MESSVYRRNFPRSMDTDRNGTYLSRNAGWVSAFCVTHRAVRSNTTYFLLCACRHIRWITAHTACLIHPTSSEEPLKQAPFDTDRINEPQRYVMLILPVYINLKWLSVGTGKDQAGVFFARLARLHRSQISVTIVAALETAWYARCAATLAENGPCSPGASA